MILLLQFWGIVNKTFPLHSIYRRNKDIEKRVEEIKRGIDMEMKVSVYCLVYNHEKYIRDALDGFVNQVTDFDYEVIVHDDASTDSSPLIIKEYAGRYPNIIKPIFQKENKYSKGIRITEKYIFPLIQGKYVASCEGDDYWIDNYKLQKQVDFLEENPDYVACVHNTRKLDLWKKKEDLMYVHEYDVDINFCDVVSDGGCAYHTSSLMYRREFIKNRPVFMQEKRSFGDYSLAIYLSICGKIRFLSDVMSVYRFGAVGSWSRKTQTDFERMDSVIAAKIDLLNEVNEFTMYKYNDIIQSAVLRHNYSRNEIAGNYCKLRKPPYREIYNGKPFKYKAKLLAKQIFDKPYRYLRIRFYNK